MSRASFPRTEHSVLLQENLATLLSSLVTQLEFTSLGLDHYRCSYRFGFRLRAQSGDAEWKELSIHFQLADRLEQSGDVTELKGIFTRFVERNFGGLEMPRNRP